MASAPNVTLRRSLFQHNLWGLLYPTPIWPVLAGVVQIAKMRDGRELNDRTSVPTLIPAQRASTPTVRSSDAERAEGDPGVFRGTTAVATAKERGLWVTAVTFPGNSLAC